MLVQCCIGWAAATLISRVYGMFISIKFSENIVERAAGIYIERVFFVILRIDR